jgi:PTH1 family peptidyl-tRNA hydrolase
MVLNRLAAHAGETFRKSRWGELAETRVGTEKILYLKPLTYMNLSGEAVQPILAWHKLDCTELLVVCDDMDLPLGRLRLRTRGSAGGHNGLKSIIERLGTQDFWRLRLGVGRPLYEGSANYVLGNFAQEELPEITAALERAVQAALLWQAGNGEKAMSSYNQVFQ